MLLLEHGPHAANNTFTQTAFTCSTFLWKAPTFVHLLVYMYSRVHTFRNTYIHIQIYISFHYRRNALCNISISAHPDARGAQLLIAATTVKRKEPTRVPRATEYPRSFYSYVATTNHLAM
ncbi:unnamed protein product [Ceratitis capitata]|uniref:(Mediterranean fruit fly) hypothetical protein n=1 Tax=Ceratitis capitata TaxID=7213 RepID=A0A811U8G0_CERCA|nr:unnamed protein product [Ceratitis capitata]